MAVTVKVSEVIDRPVSDVFHSTADEHVRNHPRWDPDMQLEQLTDGPLGVGTVISRVNTHSGSPVKGTMEVVEFERDRVMGFVIHDGPVETRSRTTYEVGPDGRTVLTVNVEWPGMDESTDTTPMARAIQRSFRNIKRLVESEG